MPKSNIGNFLNYLWAMAKPNLIRCVNKTTNKVRYFSPTVANDAIWRKHTGFEIAQVGHDIPGFELGAGTPIVRTAQAPKVDIESEIERRVAERLAQAIPAIETLAKATADKPKRKYTKKQPA